MLKIGRNNKVLLTKGDDAELQIKVYDKDHNEVAIKSGDVLALTIKETAGSTSAALAKTAVVDTFYFTSGDTASLSAGLYVYDIQYTDGETEEISTVIPLSFFEILEEVSPNE